MDITFDKVSKRFIKEWVIRDFSFEFKANHSIAITGANGSGKSTLLKLITGIMPITVGQIEYRQGLNKISEDDAYKYMTFCSPYQELIEEFSLAEMIRFHKSFRKMEDNLHERDYADLWQLSHALNKPIHFYSSGMKQRVKVGLALSTTSQVTLLDEPTSNLDEKGKTWYMDQVEKVLNKRTLIVASNIREEYTFCSDGVSLNVN
ncbi:MAG: ATP-binding cassette domain-containing protein [Bacteroidota bacterium]